MLCGLYAKLQAVLQQMPKDAAYRTYTQQIVQQRLQIVQAVSERPETTHNCTSSFQETNINAIEEKIGCGQVEELIEQVRDILTHLSILLFLSNAGRERAGFGSQDGGM